MIQAAQASPVLFTALLDSSWWTSRAQPPVLSVCTLLCGSFWLPRCASEGRLISVPSEHCEVLSCPDAAADRAPKPWIQLGLSHCGRTVMGEATEGLKSRVRAGPQRCMLVSIQAIWLLMSMSWGFLLGQSVRNPQENAGDCLQCRKSRFDTWVGKIRWRRKWQASPVFLPGESHGQRSLADYSNHHYSPLSIEKEERGTVQSTPERTGNGIICHLCTIQGWHRTRLLHLMGLWEAVLWCS